MAIDALVKPFLRLPLFAGLKPLQLTEIVRRAGRIIYKPGDMLIEEDAVGDCAIVIVSGEALRLSTEDDGAPAEPIAEGSMVAELAMLVETVHSCTVIARTPIRALKITRADMHELMEEDPDLSAHMMSSISARLSALVQELQAIDGALATMTEPGNISDYAPARAQMSSSESISPLH